MGNQNWKYALLIVAIFSLLIFLLSKIRPAENLVEMYKASQDSLTKTRNELNQEVATRDVLYGSVEGLQILNAKSDSMLAKLQKQVDKLTIAAIVLSNQTSNKIKETSTVTSKDTIRTDSITYVYPEYSLVRKNQWEDIRAVANKDSFNIDYKVFNNYTIKQKFEKRKLDGYLFKQQVPVIQIVNENPNTETLEMQSFVVQPKKGKGTKGFTVGVAIGLVGGYLLFK